MVIAIQDLQLSKVGLFGPHSFLPRSLWAVSGKVMIAAFLISVFRMYSFFETGYADTNFFQSKGKALPVADYEKDTKGRLWVYIGGVRYPADVL